MATPEVVSAAFILPAGRLGERVRHVLAVIDAVHQAGPLPRIPIDDRVGVPGADGRYRYQPRRGRTQGSGLNPSAPRLELVLLHEIGHFLDHRAFGCPGRFASRRHPDLADWRRAVLASDACVELRRDRRLAALSGQTVDAFEYLLDPSELWARSYAQYVTHRSGDATLLEQLAKTRLSVAPYHLAQWEDDDFRPIGATIDGLLRRKGWL